MRLNSWQNRGALLALLLAWPAATPAAEVTVTAAAARPPAEAPALEMKDNAVQLSLDQAVTVALQQNLGLVIERYTRTQQRLGITQALGIYDLLGNVTLSATDAQSPTLSTIEASQSNQQEFDFSFRQTIPTGGAVSVGWQNSRSESNSPVLETPTFFNSGFTFAYTQPLLRNLGRLATERGILVAQTNSRISRQQFELQVISTVQQVVDAYWNLVGAREQLVVAQQSLDLAKELHERNKIQVEVGTMAPLELTQSQAAIASREEGIIRATSTVGDAEDQLRLLLNLPAGELWKKPIVPTTAPETEALSTIDVEAAIQTALAGRPELRTNELQLAQARLDAQYFHNQSRPSLNLNVNYGYSGVGLNFNDAVSQVTGLDFRGWSAQLIYGYPIQNRSARAQSAIANLDADRVQTVVDQEKATIATEVRRAARAVETAAKQIDAARVAREFQEQNLDAERKRYENGMSTSFQITQIQDQVTQARSDEVTAKITYRTALAEYYRVIGKLLEQQEVAIDDPETPAYAAGRFSFRRPPLPGGK